MLTMLNENRLEKMVEFCYTLQGLMNDNLIHSITYRSSVAENVFNALYLI